ncbi:cation diffusion facilitator family transporter [Parageobacillus thermoglucosidasius]|uniref:cation diffusion facilitator family transporter n=1 Tax=Parageobacillus thermoglucosidasius TaxID=1426 RepID=UPI000B56F72C|nr:cation diffusion facilitator family transporter [Parageobacillus thermoglucosidasius]OUM90460.1 MAG: zinc transporter ZitB [Parageobacillus thermoglucosidasius]
MGLGHHHGHGHEHGHNHAHGRSTNKKLLTIALTITVGFMIAEIIGGLLSNSLALLSDAGHMFSDAFSLFLSLIAIRFAAMPATEKRTYGFYRFEILAAFINGVSLAAIAIYIYVEAYQRLISPPEVQSTMMIAISVLGLLANLAAARVLMRGNTSENLNLRSAFLHVVGDALGSIGAIIAGLLILFFDWYIADPIISIVVATLILFSGWRVTKESVHILIEGTPKHIDLEEINKKLHSIPGIQSIHDLHVWTITSGMDSLSCHIVIDPGANAQEILLASRKLIHDTCGIDHITIQIETENLKEQEPHTCLDSYDKGHH